jgi:hypothetical protein
MTKQPFLGSHRLPLWHEEEAEKGALKIFSFTFNPD